VRLSSVRLLVDDYPACVRFYRDVLGLETAHGDEDSGYAMFAAAGAYLALFERGQQADVVDLRPAGDAAVVVLHVDDIDETVARLGDVVFDGPHDRRSWRVRVAYLRDPAGNLIELNQDLPRESAS
jgi:catechol 2,3-dioxygenase-like lactoylglutathione lyase family enzyme